MEGLTRTTTLSLTLFSTPLWADVHSVAPGQSIQAAVDAAADGDVIVLDSGLYVETVEVMLKNISIRGAGSDRTVWEPASGAMLESTFSNLIVEGIAFEHGTGASTAGSTRGGALFIQSSTIEVYDCSFYNNRSAGGGAVYLSNADAIVSGCQFEENYLTTGSTGGTTIYSNYATLDVHDSTFEENGWGGSGFAYGTVQVSSGQLYASNCYFNHNQSTATGFGLIESYGIAGHCTFVDSIHYGNVVYGSNFTLLDSVFLSSEEPPLEDANLIYQSGTVEVAGCVLPMNSDVTESTSTIPGALNVVRLSPEFGTVNGYLVPLIDSTIEAIAGSADSLYSHSTIEVPSMDLHGQLRDTPRSVGAIETTGAPAPSCPTDVDHNNRTDYVDLIAVLTQWGVADESRNEDFNRDGFVDLNDLSTVLSNWGPCSSDQVERSRVEPGQAEPRQTKPKSSLETPGRAEIGQSQTGRVVIRQVESRE